MQGRPSAGLTVRSRAHVDSDTVVAVHLSLLRKKCISSSHLDLSAATVAPKSARREQASAVNAWPPVLRSRKLNQLRVISTGAAGLVAVEQVLLCVLTVP